MTHPESLAHVRAAHTATSNQLRDLMMRRQALREDLAALDERIHALGKAFTCLGDALDALDPSFADHGDEDPDDLHGLALYE